MDSRLIIILIAVLAVFGPSRCGCAPIGYRGQGGVAGRGFRAEESIDDDDTNSPKKLEMYVEHHRSDKYNLKLVDNSVTTESNNNEIDTEKYEVVLLPDDLSVTCQGGSPTQENFNSSSAKSEATISTMQPQNRESNQVPSTKTTTCKPSSKSPKKKCRKTTTTTMTTTTTCRPDPAEQPVSETQTPCCEKHTADQKSSPEVVVTHQTTQTNQGWITVESCTVKMTCTGMPTTTTVTSVQEKAKKCTCSGVCSNCGERRNLQRRNLRKRRGFTWER